VIGDSSLGSVIFSLYPSLILPSETSVFHLRNGIRSVMLLKSKFSAIEINYKVLIYYNKTFHNVNRALIPLFINIVLDLFKLIHILPTDW
jgi:hypothetical protein